MMHRNTFERGFHLREKRHCWGIDIIGGEDLRHPGKLDIESTGKRVGVENS